MLNNSKSKSWLDDPVFDGFRNYVLVGHVINDDYNSFLRSGISQDPDVIRKIYDMDLAFASMPKHVRNPYPMKVYRGIPLTSDLKAIIDGKSKTNIFVDEGFVATSKDRKIAQIYADCQNKPSVILQIIVPGNSCVLDFERLPIEYKQTMEGNKEVLLPRNAQFKIQSYDPKTRTVKATYIGQKLPLKIPPRPQLLGLDCLGNYNKKRF